MEFTSFLLILMGVQNLGEDTLNTQHSKKECEKEPQELWPYMPIRLC